MTPLRALIPFALCAPAALAQVLADGEGETAAIESRGGSKVAIDPDGPAAGRGSIRAIPGRGGELFAVRLAAPIDPARTATLRARLRVSAVQDAQLMWLARDAKGRILFRRMTLPDGGLWVRMEWPLASWVWGDRVGGWEEVKELELRATTSVERVWVDELALEEGPGGAWLGLEELGRAVFGGEAHRAWERGGVRLLVCVERPPGDAQVEKFFARAAAIEELLARVGGPAARTGAPPAALVLFASPEARARGAARLGNALRATLNLTRNPGSSFQDLGLALWDPQAGLERPVNAGQLTSALAARVLRISSAIDRQRWLSGALGSWVQVCVHPRAAPREDVIAVFARGRDDPQAFAPLQRLLGDPAAEVRAAQAEFQCASLIAFLHDERPELLAALIRGVGEGMAVSAIVRAAGTDLDELDATWWAWGRRVFAPGSQGPVFAAPPELR